MLLSVNVFFLLFKTATEGSLGTDFEIQNWGAELVKSRDDGGVGIKVCR